MNTYPDPALLHPGSIAPDIHQRNAQIAQAQSEIKQRNITITTLTDEINKKVSNINSLEKRIQNDKGLLADLIKKKDQSEKQALPDHVQLTNVSIALQHF
jgi:chromosome segregation ATPase